MAADNGKENIVYLLGAGFSAPIGLPVIRNFLMKAKDQFAIEQSKFGYFGEVFKKIDEMHRSKSYINLDLFNIEEILSVLEMDSKRNGVFSRDHFEAFIKDVIKYYTPDIVNKLSGAAGRPFGADALFATDDNVARYVSFVASLLHISFVLNDSGPLDKEKCYFKKDFKCFSQTEFPTKYSIISLNYDTVIEDSRDAIVQSFTNNLSDIEQIELVKLHGSIDTKIIPPTWNKTLPQEIEDQWSRARELLEQANQIRILGYSLPESDVYVKYLLSVSFLTIQNLKQIDVICLDPDGSVRRRYEQMITFPNFRFKNADLLEYMKTSEAGHCMISPKFLKRMEGMERTHDAFMSEAGDKCA